MGSRGSRGSSNTSSRWRPLRRRPHSCHHNSRLWDGAAGGAASATFPPGWSRYAHGLGGGESTDWGHPFTFSATFNHSSSSMESQEQRGRLAGPPQGPAQPRRDVSRMKQRCLHVCAAVVGNESIGHGAKLTSSYNSPVTLGRWRPKWRRRRDAAAAAAAGGPGHRRPSPSPGSSARPGATAANTGCQPQAHH